jgi:hypothetical protein
MKVLALTVVISLSMVGQAWADDVTPQKAGEPAPFTGLLVPEARFTELLEAEIELVKLKKQQKIDEKYMLNLEDMYKKQLTEATKPPKWYETPSANRWFGFTIGIVVTALAVYGGAQLVKASGNGG